MRMRRFLHPTFSSPSLDKDGRGQMHWCARRCDGAGRCDGARHAGGEARCGLLVDVQEQRLRQ
jgi:hypothetical protein